MNLVKNVTIVGGGNVAKAFAARLAKHKDLLVTMMVRKPHAYTHTGSEAINILPWPGNVPADTQAIIIAASDQSIESIAEHLAHTQALVVHTAGSVPAQALGPNIAHKGVLYPLQSLRPETGIHVAIPLYLSVSQPADAQLLVALAERISTQWSWAGDDERMQMHLNAVLVSNFANHLYATAYQRMQHQSLDFTMLLPLIHETAHRMQGQDPRLWQTGPAIRKDAPTLQKHATLLSDDASLKQLYEQMSLRIQQFGKG